jgi:hypothetical protein
MYTDEDRRRLLESQHDIAAVDKPATLSASNTTQSSITESRDELKDARKALQSAAHSVIRERSETDAERAKLDQALSTLVRRYGFIRVKVQDALLNIDPEITVSATEIERRTRLIERIFPLNPTELGRMAQADLIEFTSAVAHALSSEPDLKPLAFADSFATAYSHAKTAANELRRETSEDAQAMTTLRNARNTFDCSASAHALLVESILVRNHRKDDIGQFILARNAAYAARRAARAPISDEPGANNVDQPAPETPDAAPHT